MIILWSEAFRANAHLLVLVSATSWNFQLFCEISQNVTLLQAKMCKCCLEFRDRSLIMAPLQGQSAKTQAHYMESHKLRIAIICTFRRWPQWWLKITDIHCLNIKTFYAGFWMSAKWMDPNYWDITDWGSERMLLHFMGTISRLLRRHWSYINCSGILILPRSLQLSGAMIIPLLVSDLRF